ncbi:nucleotidyltransferase family protein [Oricola sp.]|uniref:nucleotidyltransferase family protein n=1 Tax=Oricola sp. TaxID=1979950 RepID=UPI003BA87265
MSSKVGGWLARLSDPQGMNMQWHSEPFSMSETGLLETLVDDAGRHNVRPAMTSNLASLLRTVPDALLSGDAAWRKSEGDKLLSSANASRLLDVGRAMLLASAASDILDAVADAGLPVVLVKGVDFAENAYGGLNNRTFSDIDLLVRPDAEDNLGEILQIFGFTLHEPKERLIANTERQWTRADSFGGWIVVDVHTDMVHAPELRARQTLTYDLYADPRQGGVSPASRLVLAALHGATSHLFGRLQYVVDGLMIVRMGVDPAELRERALRSGAVLPVATLLRLAADLYGCQASAGLLQSLPPIRWSGLEKRLITGSMVVSAKDADRWRLLPQRFLYRRLLQGP